jgi:hypothetical protein
MELELSHSSLSQLEQLSQVEFRGEHSSEHFSVCKMSLISTLDTAVIDITTSVLDGNNQLITNSGTGFFIYRDYVMTSASVVLTNSTRNPPSTYYLQRVERIVGLVHDGQGCVTEIQLSLVGISPINDIAVLLAIDPPAHGILNWGNSQTATPGSTVYTYGNLLNEDLRALSSGVLRSNTLSYEADPNIAQLLDTNIALGGGMGGAPIVDGTGNVLGLVSFTVNWLQQSGYLLSTGTTAGSSQYIAEFVLEQIAEGRYCELVIDPLGNWLRWMPTSFGASFKYIQPIDLLTLPAGRASTLSQVSPDVLDSQPLFNQVQGAMITSISKGADIGRYLSVGDIVEEVFGNPIGYYNSSQSSISTALWKVIPGAVIPVKARLKSENYSTVHSFDIGTMLMPQEIDVIYSSAQTLSTNIISEPSNKDPTAPVPPTNLYATIVFFPSPFNGNSTTGLTAVFYPEFVSVTNGTFTLQPGKYQVQISGLTASGSTNYSLTFNQGSTVLSTISYEDGNVTQGSFSFPLTNVIIVPAVGTIVVDYILDVTSTTSFFLEIDASGITESSVNIYNYVS